VLHRWSTPWRAVQESAWRALNTPLAEDYSLSEETPPWFRRRDRRRDAGWGVNLK